MSGQSFDHKNHLPSREKEILNFWHRESIFEKSLLNSENKPYYSFYDGPPFATGLPHYGHLLAGTIKDVIGRYATMNGYNVPRRFGWDCHGVPVEYEVEKTLSLKNPGDIDKFGIHAFNEACRDIVLKYSSEWVEYTNRIGRWVDFNATWKTMDTTFMESVWWVFKELYKKDLIYEGIKVVPYSTKLGTPLSNFEAGQNYRDVDDPSVVIRFFIDDKASLLVWTTTPWTLISNMAVAVGKNLIYVRIEDSVTKEQFILGKGCLDRWFSDSQSYNILETLSGLDLVGKVYKPVFDFFSSKKEEGAFKVVAGDFVEESDGTGIVHMAPAFGEVDFFACKDAGVPLVCPVNSEGCFHDAISDFKGMHVKEADKLIIRKLKDRGLVFYHGTIKHRYPFCWRTDTPLIYKAVNSWFVSVEKLKDKLIAANSNISWVPDHIKSGRFGKWLENARDWAISRNRYWGTPIPIWRNDLGDILVIGSVKELEELTNRKIEDIHRHFIDDIEIVKDGSVYHRVSEVFDCWFDSGAMPYAQNHFPFENEELTKKSFPADFIAEGLDQTRGWFYTLNVISVALFDQPAFKNAVVSGIILAEDGSKMSKRLNNYPSPLLIMDKYGADALRLYLLNSVAVKGEDLAFSDKGVESVLKQILIPLTNATNFFVTYAKIYGINGSELDASSGYTQIDHWILSALYSLVDQVRDSMERYVLNTAVEPFVSFIDDLTNWYIRRNRRRFWASEDTPDRRAAFVTLYQVLITLCKIIAPFIPFIAEDIYQKLRKNDMPESVHLCDFPSVDKSCINLDLENLMTDVREIVSMGHSLRKEHKLKVRQPLSSFYIIGNRDKLNKLTHFVSLIKEELNIKDIVFYKDAPDFVSASIKPNFRSLGKKAGAFMQEVQKILSNLSSQDIHGLQENGSLDITLSNGNLINISLDDVHIIWMTQPGYVAQNSLSFTVVLDCQLSEELVVEGHARELVNKINTIRRNQNLEVTDRIQVSFFVEEIIKKAFLQYQDYICNETLITDFAFANDMIGDEWDINGFISGIKIEVV